MLLYIDPGTGSMLFTILVGLLGAGFYASKKLLIKLKFIFSGGAKEKANKNIIPFVIFSDSKRYWNIFESICDEFERRGKTLVYMTASPDDPALEKNYNFVKCQFIGEGNKAFVKLNMLKADIVISTTPGLDVYQWKRSPDVKYYVHISHGVGDVTIYRMFGLDYYDAVYVSGEYKIPQIRKLEQLRNLPEKELKVAGLIYLDALQQKLKSFPKEENKSNTTTVLLAPSWGPNSIFNKFGTKIFESLLKTGYHIIVRPHPQTYTSEAELLKELKEKYPESEQLEWNSDNDNFEVLRRSDILISDFSGVLFDFALVFDKPIIYTDTHFDKSVYDACWLDDELWVFKTLGKIGQKLTEEKFPVLKEMIDNGLKDTQYAQARENARNEGWAYRGEATKNTVDFLLEKYDQLHEKDSVEIKGDK